MNCQVHKPEPPLAIYLFRTINTLLCFAEQGLHASQHSWLQCPQCVSRWTGGKYGVGSRIKLRYTRAIVDGIHSGELTAAEVTPTPIFNLQVQHVNNCRIVQVLAAMTGKKIGVFFGAGLCTLRRQWGS